MEKYMGLFCVWAVVALPAISIASGIETPTEKTVCGLASEPEKNDHVLARIRTRVEAAGDEYVIFVDDKCPKFSLLWLENDPSARPRAVKRLRDAVTRVYFDPSVGTRLREKHFTIYATVVGVFHSDGGPKNLVFSPIDVADIDVRRSAPWWHTLPPKK